MHFILTSGHTDSGPRNLLAMTWIGIAKKSDGLVTQVRILQWTVAFPQRDKKFYLGIDAVHHRIGRPLSTYSESALRKLAIYYWKFVVAQNDVSTCHPERLQVMNEWRRQNVVSFQRVARQWKDFLKIDLFKCVTRNLKKRNVKK